MTETVTLENMGGENYTENIEITVYDPKGFQKLVEVKPKPTNVEREMNILDLEHQIQYAKQKIDINEKETEFLIKEIKECKLKLAEIKSKPIQ